MAPNQHLQRDLESRPNTNTLRARCGSIGAGPLLRSGRFSMARQFSEEIPCKARKRHRLTFERPNSRTTKGLAKWKEWVKHFDERGWRDRLFLLVWDEPAAGDHSKVLLRETRLRCRELFGFGFHS